MSVVALMLDETVAVGSGISNVQFGISDMDNVVFRARVAAVQNAKMVAESICNELGVQLLSPMVVRDKINRGPYQPRTFAFAEVKTADISSVSPGETEVIHTVDVSFEISK